ncbi:MAG TPA: hypothetical protein VN903_06010, partial [Polyangia bacterium]|nr:hypothetical protein [Polyangia bacterium]
MNAVPGSRWSGLQRWGVVVIAIVAAGGCSRRPLRTHTEKTMQQPTKPTRPSIYVATNRNVDLLFLIDDSTSMRESQDNLLRNFPVLMKTLKNLPGGLPNIHVAVVSSDMGAGDGLIGSCNSTGGKRGIFQNTARGTCTATGLATGARFISNIAGAANYSGNLEDVFTCIAALGDQGCGFERQFGAITRSLGVDGQSAPVENAGFLRNDALLAIVMITNEDDCSSGIGENFYDVTSNSNIASQLGPIQNFRCNEFGHICDGDAPDREPPNNDPSAMVSYQSCMSNEKGFLLAVQDTADRIKSLKADDGQIMLTAITGPATPYVVQWKEPMSADTSCGAASCPWPVIEHSCMATDRSYADPAVRIAELVGKFGDNGRLVSICEADFAPALGNVASNIARYVNAPCILGRVAKRPGTTADDCTVVDADTAHTVASCDDTG